MDKKQIIKSFDITKKSEHGKINNETNTLCKDCQFFKNIRCVTGFCNYHQMFVTREFHCPQFILKELHLD